MKPRKYKLSACLLPFAGGLSLWASAEVKALPAAAPLPPPPLRETGTLANANGIPASNQVADVATENNATPLDILPNANRSLALKEQFSAATDAFRAERFREASELFETLAKDCPHSELQVQCEYFACISAWNHEPSLEHLNDIDQWLVRARTYEEGLRVQGRAIRSAAWPQWIETAHLIGIKHASGIGELPKAELRLRRLTKRLKADVVDKAPDLAAFAERLESFAWPATSECTPHTWFELGMILTARHEGLAEAIECFEKVIAIVEESESQSGTQLPGNAAAPSSSKNPEWVALADSARLALAKCYIALDQFDAATERVAQLAQSKLTPEQQVHFLLLRIRTEGRGTQGSQTLKTDSAATLKTAVEIALEKPLSANCYNELIGALIALNMNHEAMVTSKRLIEHHPHHAFSRDARVRLARHCAEEGKWNEVLSWSEPTNLDGSPQPVQQYANFLRGKAYKQLRRPEEAIEALNQLLQANSLAKNLETAVRVELTELHYQSERWNELAPHLDWLLEQAKLLQDTPAWFPTILLRQAELFASKSAWKEAESLVSEVCAKFPEWAKASEAEYLLARCFVAKAEFDPARELLERILHRSPDQVSSTLAARAGWMTGETYMMQRRYSEAVVSYQRVLSIPQEPYWHAASAFQIGQCAELCHDPEAAVEWYTKVQTDYADFPFAQNADERLKQLASSSPKQAERIGSGKKR